MCRCLLPPYSSSATMMLVVFCALIAFAKATIEYESPSYASTGTSNQYRTQDVAGNYRFGYDESHASGGTFRDETGDSLGNKYGSYGLHDADGRYRVVNYVADANGFRAEIKSNEPGVDSKNPAATSIFKQETTPVVQSPIVQTPIVHTPIAQKTIVHAPIAQTPIAQTPIVQSPIVQKPVLYAAPISSYSVNPEYPLLYHNNYNSYYAPYSTYKGTPFRTYKGTQLSTYKGTQFRSYAPYYKGSPYIRRAAPLFTNQGYYVYP